MSLIVTGTVGIDTVYTPSGDHREEVLGGSCVYFAAAASFYTDVRMVAAVGDDFPEHLDRQFARFDRIDPSGLEYRRGSKTFRWGGRYHGNMDSRETLFTELGVLAEDPPTVPREFRESRYVFLANTHPAVQLRMLDQLPQRALTVADTMDLWIRTARDELDTLIASVDGLVLNFDEAELLTGRANTVSAARRIASMGPRFVVVKKGEHGCLFVHNGRIGALPAYPSETVVDPTGAGDSFAGGMMGHIASHTGEDAIHDFDAFRRAMAHGTVMASFTIEAFSLDRLLSLSRGEIQDRYDDYARMMRL
jgi:sugar/nucleoside kinase (ribokinase family)